MSFDPSVKTELEYNIGSYGHSSACVCVHTFLRVWAGTSRRVKGSALKGLNEHWNAASAVTRSYDQKQEGGWLLWMGEGVGRQQRC